MCTRENVCAVRIVSSVDPSSISRISHPLAARAGVLGLGVEEEGGEDWDVEFEFAFDAPLAFRRLVVAVFFESAGDGDGDSFSSVISIISPAAALVVP